MARERIPRYLTKTRYVNGLACRKWLWLAFNAPERLPKAEGSAQYRMEEGGKVGELARRLYPTGELLPAEDPQQNDRRSRKLLSERRPMFEAGFIHPDGVCYSRADVLLPTGKGEWDLVEVKSTGGVKEEHLHDVSFQDHCYSGAGLRIRRCFVLHVNTQYERSGEINLAQLFQAADVTEATRELAPTVEPHIADLRRIANLQVCPEFGRGEPFHNDEAGVHHDDSVWKDHPGSDIQGLYRGGKQVLELLEHGVFRIKDISSDLSLRGNQVIQRAAHVSGQVYVDRSRISAFLRELNYPLQFLDFETFGTAIPLFEGVRPYQQIPFQFSVQILEEPGQAAVQHSYLSMTAEDPRKTLLESLRKVLGTAGSIVAYNQSFEKRILADLAELFPDSKNWVSQATQRFVDLLTPFRNFAYYNPAQGGSASLKEVLPAITGQGYEGFEIANGSQASIEYLYATFGMPDGKRASPSQQEDTWKALVRYCARDTEGMVRIVEKLAELTRAAA